MDEKNCCIYYTAADLMALLGISRSRAYKLLKQMNDELEEQGYIVVAGKVPKKYFSERCYGLA